MADPYRQTPEQTRYRVTVNGELFEGDRFAEVIAQLRERGYSDAIVCNIGAIVYAALDPRAVTLEVDLDINVPVRLAIANPCPRCQGAGVTRWAAFVAGLAGLLAGLFGDAVEATPCPRCDGSGRVG